MTVEESAAKSNDPQQCDLPLKSNPLPPSGHRWFEFNDSHTSPTLAKAIEKMFQGKQSAYMLFYRRKNLQRPSEARSNPAYAVPERLQLEVAKSNTQLEAERAQYDKAVNTVRLNLHLSEQYTFANGALHRVAEGDPYSLLVDKRKPVAELKLAILEALPELDECPATIHIAKHVPAGIHLYSCVSGNDVIPMSDVGITDETHLFLWDGEQVGGKAIQVGTASEPILLNIVHHSVGGAEQEFVTGFPKNATLGELRAVLGDLLGCRPSQVTISHVKMMERKGESHVVVLTGSKDKYTLDELKFSDGVRLAAERDAKKGVKSLAHSVADKQSKLISLIVEDRCSSLPSDPSNYPVFPVEVGRDEPLSAIKKLILGLDDTVKGGGRLRVDNDSSGLGPPLHEDQTVTDAGLTQGQRVVMEPGQPPLGSQLVLQCALQRSSAKVEELIVDRSTTVAECCARMIVAAGLEGTQWHLRKTNWCGEAADLLEDESATLDGEKLKSGDLLLIEEGKLPPKGYIRLPVYLYTIESSEWGHDVGDNDMVLGAPGNGDPIETGVEDTTAAAEVPLHLINPSQYYPPLHGNLTEIGTLEVSRDANLDDLKAMILTLPALEGLPVPILSYLRVREITEGRPGKILKQTGQTLRRLKLTSNSQVCCNVLPAEENLPPTTVVFNVAMRIPGERRYGPPVELTYDTAVSTSPSSLRSHVARALDLPDDRTVLAKYKMETFQWIRIQEKQSPNGDGAKRGRKRTRKGGGASSINIKNAPIQLRDGDLIGVKDLQYDPDDQDDFSLPNDKKGRAVLAAIQEEKRRKRKAKEGNDIFGGEPTRQRPRRPEIGIRIYVPDYRNQD